MRLTITRVFAVHVLYISIWAAYAQARRALEGLHCCYRSGCDEFSFWEQILTMWCVYACMLAVFESLRGFVFAKQEAESVQQDRDQAAAVSCKMDDRDDVVSCRDFTASLDQHHGAVLAENDAATLSDDKANPEKFSHQSRSDKESAGSVWAIDDITSASSISLKAGKGSYFRSV